MRLKHKLRTWVDRSAQLSGLLRHFEARMRTGLTVLMYHRILPAERCARYPLRSLAMPCEAFREQVRWLAERCDVLPLGEALEKNREALDKSRAASTRPLVAITFDDGYADNAQLAAPILEEAGLRATFFVVTDFIASREPLWFDRAVLAFEALPEERWQTIVSSQASDAGAPMPDAGSALAAWMGFLKELDPGVRTALVEALSNAAEIGPFPEDATTEGEYGPMSLESLRALAQRGHEIGSHTLSHPLLPQLEPAELERELSSSRSRLADWLGAAPRGFCYPNGDCDARVVRAVQAAGYSYACRIRPALNLPGQDPFLVNRIDLSQDRVLDGARGHDGLAFRSELCLLREIWR